MNPNHLASASRLTTILFSPETSAYVRARVAGGLSSAFRVDCETEAMFELSDALRRLVCARAGVVWGPFAYTCVRHLLKIEREEAVRKCEDELRNQDEWARHMLINELAEVAGADVILLLLRHFKREDSARVAMQVMRVLGDLLPESQRARVLATGLADESPSCRFLAIKGLSHVRPKIANELALRNLQLEPDDVLRNLLAEAISATAQQGRKASRAGRKPPP